MAKRASNILEAQLPSPPSVPQFLAIVRRWKEEQEQPKAKDPVHGDLLANSGAGVPVGTNRVEKAAVSSVLEFVGLCESLEARYESLDLFFVGWVGWIMDPQHMFDAESDREACWTRRKSQARGTFRVFKMSCSSVRTYVNSVARVFSSFGVENGAIVPSARKQFPELNNLMQR